LPDLRTRLFDHVTAELSGFLPYLEGWQVNAACDGDHLCFEKGVQGLDAK
jgi:hypothetical protein